MKIRFCVTLLLALLVCALASQSGEFRTSTNNLSFSSLAEGRARQEHIQIHNYHLCVLLVGQNTGTWLKFWVRWDLDKSYLFSHPLHFSTTWHDTGRYDRYGRAIVSDVLFVGQTKLRVDFVIGAPIAQNRDESERLGEGLSYDGYLGLGMYSRLWSLWNSVLVSPLQITFGGGAKDAQQFRHETLGRPLQFAALAQWQHYALRRYTPTSVAAQYPFSFSFVASLDGHTLGDLGTICDQGGASCAYADAGHNYTVLISPTADYSTLPPQMSLLVHKKKRIWFRPHTARQSYLLVDTHADKYIDTSGGVAIKQSACRFGADKNLVVIGGAALRRFVWSYNFATGQIFFAPLCKGTICVDGAKEVERLENTLVTLSALVAFVAWAVIAQPKHTTKMPPQQQQTKPRRNVLPPGQGAQKIVLSLSEQTQQKHDAAAHEIALARGRLRKLTKYAVFLIGAPVQWNYSLEEVDFMRAATEIVVGACLLLATVHFRLDLQLSVAAHISDAAALCTVVLLVALITVFLVVSRVSAAQHPLYSSCAIQSGVALTILCVTLPSAVISNTAVIYMTLAALFVQYNSIVTSVHTIIEHSEYSTPILFASALIYLVCSLAVIPFSFERIYGAHPNNLSLASMFCAAIVLPSAAIVLMYRILYREELFEYAFQKIVAAFSDVKK